ncbi:hypothetical protein BU16DRAFT_45242 [Lophium mytilinum]|uniref:Uncharacterized protein n=1 Tax=Lophium mytilinum TaxID=390894 RepID=A0A6A6QR73_9PEZI|nr:hypothetical protein BU16DRAFT_45242 [Lophium mytilinum]
MCSTRASYPATDCEGRRDAYSPQPCPSTDPRRVAETLHVHLVKQNICEQIACSQSAPIHPLAPPSVPTTATTSRTHPHGLCFDQPRAQPILQTHEAKFAGWLIGHQQSCSIRSDTNPPTSAPLELGAPRNQRRPTSRYHHLNRSGRSPQKQPRIRRGSCIPHPPVR